MSQHSDTEYLFTSESVTEGHPDKIADQISDGVLDAVLKDDPYGRVACETLVNTGLVVVSGEISTDTYVDIPEIARSTTLVAGLWHPDEEAAKSYEKLAQAGVSRRFTSVSEAADAIAKLITSNRLLSCA